MLESKSEVLASEVGWLFAKTAQRPDHLACCSVDLIEGGVVASRDEIVSVGVLVNAVDVEIIPRIAGAGSGSDEARVQRQG